MRDDAGHAQAGISHIGAFEASAMHTVLVLGGYGFFGSRICRALSKDSNIRLLVGGRDAVKATALATALGMEAGRGVAIDAHDPSLRDRFLQLGVDTVIHTVGPFQGQDYAVARAAISSGTNYLDLADGRDFVVGIAELDAQAKERGVLVTSGASSLPALSSAVVDRYRSRFGRIEAIRHGIGSGARAPGLATMRGVFGYVGKSISRLEGGVWVTTYGWEDTKLYRFPEPVGRRLLGSCDVPDLDLFARRYEGVKTVTFHAGFASAPGHLAVWLASTLVRLGLVSGIVPLAPPMHVLSKWLEPLTSDRGAMYVSLEGIDPYGAPLKLTWHLLAAQNHGPYVPCGASIALARVLAQGKMLPKGAMPCMGLLSVDQYLEALEGFDLTEVPA